MRRGTITFLKNVLVQRLNMQANNKNSEIDRQSSLGNKNMPFNQLSDGFGGLADKNVNPRGNEVGAGFTDKNNKGGANWFEKNRLDKTGGLIMIAKE